MLPTDETFLRKVLDLKWYILDFDKLLKIRTPIFHSFKLKSGSEPAPGKNSSLKPPTLNHNVLCTTWGAQVEPWRLSNLTEL